MIAILGVLAALVIPNWAATARNRKYDPEIAAMMTEISTREEQYKAELGNGAYLDEAQCPTTPFPNGSDFNVCVNNNVPWQTLRVVPTDPLIRCTYQVTTGIQPAQPSAPAPCAAPTGSNGVPGSWYYIVATCDMDANSATSDAQFCMSSWNTNTVQQRVNYGQ